MVTRQPVTENATPTFGFDHEFQKALLRLICEDVPFGRKMVQHLRPEYFDSEPLAWAMNQVMLYHEQYESVPSVAVVRNEARKLEPNLRMVYESVLSTVSQASLRDEEWLRTQVREFIKKNAFVRSMHTTVSLWNNRKHEEAYKLWQDTLDTINGTDWGTADRGFFFEELPQRQMNRWREQGQDKTIPTGFPWLDNILDGGLSLGEMGAWLAYAKVGKSTMLVQHGVAATAVARRPTAHFVFEGSRSMVENRYEAAILSEFYNVVKKGNLSEDQYTRAYQQYQDLRGLLVIQGFTDEWDYSVVDIHNALKDLEEEKGFKPDLVVVDYADLLRGREKKYPNETAKQQAAWRDLKSLANRGYAIWTASQAQRPKDGAEDTAHLLMARQIADAYAKVRVADFFGSLNMTHAERTAKQMRLYAEMYRDNEANDVRTVRAELAKMIIREEAGLVPIVQNGGSQKVGNKYPEPLTADPRVKQSVASWGMG